MYVELIFFVVNSSTIYAFCGNLMMILVHKSTLLRARILCVILTTICRFFASFYSTFNAL